MDNVRSQDTLHHHQAKIEQSLGTMKVCTPSLYQDFVLSWPDDGFLQPKHVAKILKYNIVKLLINICCLFGRQ
jgi:hypothetical protein